MELASTTVTTSRHIIRTVILNNYVMVKDYDNDTLLIHFYDIIDWWWKSIKSHFQLGPLLDILTNTNMTNLELDMNKCRTNDPNLLNQAKLQWKPIHHNVTGG